MLGRLPVKYRLGIGVAGVLAFALVGAWVGYSIQLTSSWTMMAVGTLLGTVAVAGFLRAMGRSRSSPPAARHGS